MAKKLTPAQQHVLDEMQRFNYTIDVWGDEDAYYCRQEDIMSDDKPRMATINALVKSGNLVEQRRRNQQLVRGTQIEVVTYVVASADPVPAPVGSAAVADEDAPAASECVTTYTPSAGDYVRVIAEDSTKGKTAIVVDAQSPDNELPYRVQFIDSESFMWFAADELEPVDAIDTMRQRADKLRAQIATLTAELATVEARIAQEDKRATLAMHRMSQAPTANWVPRVGERVEVVNEDAALEGMCLHGWHGVVESMKEENEAVYVNLDAATDEIAKHGRLMFTGVYFSRNELAPVNTEADAAAKMQDAKPAPSAPEAQPIADFEAWAVQDEFRNRYFSLRNPSLEDKQRFSALSSEDGKRVRVVVYATADDAAGE